MLVIPPDLGGEYWPIERRILRGELARFVEFADLALNAGEARKILYPLGTSKNTDFSGSGNVISRVLAS